MTISETPNTPVVGLILAGGKSSRMKKAKAHLCINKKPQWRLAEEALSSCTDEVYFSVSPQLEQPLPLSEERLIHDVFNEPCGPIGGIISAFMNLPNRTLFVLACDMPWFNHESASFLLKHRNTNKQATIFENSQGEFEPLCGIYEPAMLPKLLQFWSLKKRCARQLLRDLEVERVRAHDEKWLINVNSGEDLLALKCDLDQKKVSVHYYASLRHQAQCQNQEVYSHAKSVSELFLELALIHGFRESLASLRFAKNDVLVDQNALLEEGDTIVFIPPVSGG